MLCFRCQYGKATEDHWRAGTDENEKFLMKLQLQAVGLVPLSEVTISPDVFGEIKLEFQKRQQAAMLRLLEEGPS